MNNRLKLIASLFIIILLALALAACNEHAEEEEPAPARYNISSVEDLLAMHDMVGDKYADTVFSLQNDIDLKGVAYSPIGYSFTKAFTGTFEGNGHTISNLKINDTEEKDGAGLFGYVKDAAFSDINIESLDIDYTATKLQSFTGGLFGYGYGENKIDNVNVAGSMKIKNTWVMRTSTTSSNENEECTQSIYVGGVLGYNKGSLTLNNAEVSVDIYIIPSLCGREGIIIPFRNAFIGGAIGFVTGIDGNIDSNISKVKVNAQIIDVFATITHMGGLVGYLSNASLTNAAVKVENINISGEYSSNRADIGGVCGYTLSSLIEKVIIEDSIIDSAISNPSDIINIAGIVAYADKTQLKNSHAKNIVLLSGKIAYSGGIVGVLRYSRTMNDSNDQSLGYTSQGESVIENCTATGGLYDYRVANSYKDIEKPAGQGYDYRYDGSASMVGLIWGDSRIENCYTDFISVYGVVAEIKIEEGVDSDGNAIEGKRSEPEIGEGLFYCAEANLSQSEDFLYKLSKEEMYPDMAKDRIEIADLIASLMAD